MAALAGVLSPFGSWGSLRNVISRVVAVGRREGRLYAKGRRQWWWRARTRACATLAAGWWPLEDKGAVYTLRVDDGGGGGQRQEMWARWVVTIGRQGGRLYAEGRQWWWWQAKTRDVGALSLSGSLEGLRNVSSRVVAVGRQGGHLYAEGRR
ncbi:hypothetical protein DFJ58DRAFT_841235 [Suillus subalutaceus]|uniref:uncharacterized protein n=1 Tax=Suillus subalutaceus TaxID=48586 RepID=UPI001B869841|nr:uncharacterized protein DFJ58DRAFT_841235 [Suillus subalutaceus]KAG1854938.1 hypothetical protein DFJ58DRAFT_841235 [Suillus subalutaceus]